MTATTLDIELDIIVRDKCGAVLNVQDVTMDNTRNELNVVLQDILEEPEVYVNEQLLDVSDIRWIGGNAHIDFPEKPSIESHIDADAIPLELRIDLVKKMQEELAILEASVFNELYLLVRGDELEGI